MLSHGGPQLKSWPLVSASLYLATLEMLYQCTTSSVDYSSATRLFIFKSMYRMFINYRVFSLKFWNFSELCQFCCRAGVLPAWCLYTHWHRGKTEKSKSPEYFSGLCVSGLPTETIFEDSTIKCLTFITDGRSWERRGWGETEGIARKPETGRAKPKPEGEWGVRGRGKDIRVTVHSKNEAPLRSNLQKKTLVQSRLIATNQKFDYSQLLENSIICD